MIEIKPPQDIRDKLMLVRSDDPILHNEVENFDFQNPQMDAEELMVSLAETMVENKGLGLSAPQCGLSLRVFTVGNPLEPESVMCFFNPKVTHQSHDESIMLEGCLSFPDLFLKIKRSNEVRIRYQDVKGEWNSATFGGLSAHCILHEIDHLDGVVFTERASKFHMEKGKRKMKKYRKMREKRT